MWPRWNSRRIRVRRSGLRLARLGALRVLWIERPLRIRQVYADELPAAEFARLRRALKSSLDHAGGSERLSR